MTGILEILFQLLAKTVERLLILPHMKLNTAPIVVHNVSMKDSEKRTRKTLKEKE
tara:strand:- start:37 stop:201 length:165 start_codon:yes stop_codon:yes gene_type:complete